MMDVDSTLVDGEVIDLLAERAGCADKVAALTAAWTSNRPCSSEFSAMLP